MPAALPYTLEEFDEKTRTLHIKRVYPEEFSRLRATNVALKNALESVEEAKHTIQALRTQLQQAREALLLWRGFQEGHVSTSHCDDCFQHYVRAMEATESVLENASQSPEKA